jgi:hypothetical protein
LLLATTGGGAGGLGTKYKLPNTPTSTVAKKSRAAFATRFARLSRRRRAKSDLASVMLVIVPAREIYQSKKEPPNNRCQYY